MRKSAGGLIAVLLCLLFACGGVCSSQNKNGVFIFEYKKELALTDKQEQNLKDIVAKFQGYVEVKQKELKGLQTELSKLLAATADLDTIRAKINDIAKVQADVTYEDIANNRAIETGLTAAQLAKWRGIQAEFIHKLQQAQK